MFQRERDFVVRARIPAIGACSALGLLVAAISIELPLWTAALCSMGSLSVLVHSTRNPIFRLAAACSVTAIVLFAGLGPDMGYTVAAAICSLTSVYIAMQIARYERNVQALSAI